jgi:cyclic dehypoxanthinyl futalosine synthase
MGGTMMEENVVSQAGTTFRMTEQQIRESIIRAGFKPSRRDTFYNLLDTD